MPIKQIKDKRNFIFNSCKCLSQKLLTFLTLATLNAITITITIATTTANTYPTKPLCLGKLVLLKSPTNTYTDADELIFQM